MAGNPIFYEFCKYIDRTIFSEENIGNVVALVVDKTFINRFCDMQKVSEKSLMLAAKASLWPSYGNKYDILRIKGILAIQLYATTFMRDSAYVSAKNYRDRLVEILSWDMDSLQSWMKEYQDRYWSELYGWCDRHGFTIAKSYPKPVSGRYVQYPIQQAERVFTEEELLHFACYFNDSKLSSGEDISEESFWRIISKDTLRMYAHCSHAINILYTYSKDGYSQIYNYYLRWDGSFKYMYDQVKRIAPTRLDNLYMDEALSHIDIRDEDFNVTNRIDVEDLTIFRLNGLYTFKRDGFILFKKNDIYENYWEETRFLQEEEEGIAIRFIGNGRNYARCCPVIKRTHDIEIYSIKGSTSNPDLYTEKKFYFLEGGLKIARMKYILGGAPLLRINRATKYWIDGIAYETTKSNALIIIPDDEGHHYIKFPSQPKLEFSITKTRLKKHVWNDTYSKWNIKKENNSWESVSTETGVVGLDFSCMIHNQKRTDKPISSWAQIHVFGKKNIETDNIVVKLLRHTRNGYI